MLAINRLQVAAEGKVFNKLPSHDQDVSHLSPQGSWTVLS